MNDFETKREKWLEEVAEGCHNLAIADEGNPDFYVFQSRSDFESPELLIIGANPGSFVKYIDSNPYKEKGYRDKNNLGYESNQYIENEFNKNWHINKPMLKMFPEGKLREIFANSVIMNAIYFNTSNINELKSLQNGKEMFNFCINSTKEFVKIINPKNILFLGLDAPKWLGNKFHHIDDSVLRMNDKNYLIIQTEFMDINSFIIHHPSNKRGSFNNEENLLKKKEFFENYF